MKRVLITGAAGHIGRTLRAGLQGQYALLRLADIAPQAPAGPHEEIVSADITQPADLERIMQGIDCVVHMAGVPDESTWERVRDLNIDGCYNVFEAARRAGVKRVIFASSNHAVSRKCSAKRWAGSMPTSTACRSLACGSVHFAPTTNLPRRAICSAGSAIAIWCN